METKNIAIDKLLLDSENPRYPSFNRSQEEIIDLMFKEDKVKQLAVDIIEKKMLSPGDLLYVMAKPNSDNDKYIVLDGNRRVSALKALTNETLAGKYKLEVFEGIREVACTVFESREQANLWIDKRHGGQDSGRGQVLWNARQNNRQGLTPENNLAGSLLDYAELKNIDFKNDSISTLTRALNVYEVRKLLGIEMLSKTNFFEGHQCINFDVLTCILFDIKQDNRYDTGQTWSRWKVPEFEMWVNKYKEGLIKLPSDRSQEDSEGSQEEPEENDQDNVNSSKGRKRRRTYSNRSSTIPLNFNPDLNPESVIAKVLAEARKVPVSKYPLASAALVRCFLELLYKGYAKKHGIGYTNDTKMHTLLDRICKKEEERIRNKEPGCMTRNELVPLKRLTSNENMSLSAYTLGHYLHGGSYPESDALRNAWDNINDAIEKLIERTYP